MLNSTVAYQFSTNSQSVSDAQVLADEISAAEIAIQNAATRRRFSTLFNARLIGNPVQETDNDSALTDAQISFRNTLTEAGYSVTRDGDSGWWKISWDQIGIEYQVHVYTIRTVVSPGSVSVQTKEAVEWFFANHNPSATVRVELFSPVGSGGDVDETTFGATNSTFYEYVAVARQQNALDYSADLKTALISAGLGYNTNNLQVWRTVG